MNYTGVCSITHVQGKPLNIFKYKCGTRQMRKLQNQSQNIKSIERRLIKKLLRSQGTIKTLTQKFIQVY